MSPVMTPVKVCGLTRVQDAIAAIDLGAWALGFIFFEASPRYIDGKQVAQIVEALPQDILTVGVFVNASAERICGVVKESGIKRIQLHGDEAPSLADKLPVPYYRALRPKSENDLDALREWKGAEGILIDAAVEGQYGGTGKTSNWKVAASAKSHGKVILSGGLNPENVESALREVRPFALDVSSGIEARPGVKDLGKMEQFFEAVRRGSA